MFQMNELGRVLDNVCNIVPAGVVCFFPSYEYEQTIYQHFEKSGVLEKLSKKKKVYNVFCDFFLLKTKTRSSEVQRDASISKYWYAC